MRWLAPRATLLATMLAVSAPAPACAVLWRSAEESKQEAGLVVDGVVAAATQVSTSFTGASHEYRVRVITVERGGPVAGELRVSYDDLQPHRRGDTTVCPLKYGSGIEHALREGVRYRLYVRSAAQPELLYAEAPP